MARTAHAVAVEKQARAIELLDAGHSYDEIAEELGYANRGSAWKAVDRGLRSLRDGLAEGHLQLALDRLDAVLYAYWDAAMVDLDVKAVHVVLKVLAQQVRLLGLSDPGKRRKREAAGPTSIVLAPDPATYEAMYGGRVDVDSGRWDRTRRGTANHR